MIEVYKTNETIVSKTNPFKQVKFGESVTDKTHYRPNVSKLNDIVGATSTEIDKSQYDFPDGKDNGLRFYDIKSMALDKAEISENMSKIKSMAENERDDINTMIEEEIDRANKEIIEKNTTIETPKNTE